MAEANVAPKLSEEQLNELQTKHKKIAVVEWNDHLLVFRRPTRDECHAYRVKLEHPDTKADANEQLCQATICAFNSDMNANTARTSFTENFLPEQPMFASTMKVKIALGALMGFVEEEDLADLGKGVSVRPSRPKPTPQD